MVLPLILIVLLSSPFWYGSKHLLITPSLAHWERYDTYGANSVVRRPANGSSGAEYPGSDTLEIIPTDSLRISEVLYTAVFVVWVAITITIMRV